MGILSTELNLFASKSSLWYCLSDKYNSGYSNARPSGIQAPTDNADAPKNFAVNIVKAVSHKFLRPTVMLTVTETFFLAANLTFPSSCREVIAEFVKYLKEKIPGRLVAH